ncbi:MAG: NAD-dependent epimerase/dehydratase family protein [Stellaceae bacterium]
MVSNILVTGGAGYIGSVLVRLLLNKGYAVTVLDTFASGGTELAECCANEKFQAVRGDARNRATLKPLLAKADIVLPLAAIVGAPACARDAIGAESINRDAIVTLLSELSQDQRLVYPTSNSGYGIGEKDKYCTEESPLRPISLYGNTKVDAEKAVLDKGNGVTLRLATVFGMSPRMRIDLLVNDFTYRAMTDGAVVIFEGHFKRNYIHIRDVAKAFLHALDRYDTMNNQPYNVGLSDANLSKIELCDRIKQQVPRFTYLEAPIGEDPDKRDYIVSNAKLEATGFRPDWSLDTGITELIKGFTMLNNRRFSNV